MIVVKRVRRQDRGIALIWTVLAMTVIMAFAGWGVDVSAWYTRKASMQAAVDSAALAGAYTVGTTGDWNAGYTTAKEYIAYNRYDPTRLAYVPQANNTSNWFRATLSYDEKPWFTGAIGRHALTLNVSATAEFHSFVDAAINTADLGIAPNRCIAAHYTGTPYNFSSFGPLGQHTNGDNYGPLYLQTLNSDGTGIPNPQHPNGWKGYDFTLTVDPNYSTAVGQQLEVELFDPDCFNQGGKLDASANTYDEIRSSQSGLVGGVGNTPDTTQYTLVWTPASGADQILGQATFDGSSWWADGGATPAQLGDVPTTVAAQPTSDKNAAQLYGWVAPQPGYGLDTGSFLIQDITKYQNGGRLHMLVKNTAGASENGFSIRAGKPHNFEKYGVSLQGDCEWHAAQSPGMVTVSSHGVIPMNFDQDGVATINLGNVPATAAGSQFNVYRFDTDVGPSTGSLYIEYMFHPSDNSGDVSFGAQASNKNITGTSGGYTVTYSPVGVGDAAETDQIKLPTNYPGGTWSVRYSAGAGDSSTWLLQYGGKGSGISLVGQSGQLY